MKPPVARKLVVRHTKLVFLTASFLATNSFKFYLFQNAFMVYKHAYLNTLLLLHSAFILSVVKMLLKGEVRSHALNSHRNYIVDHGIVFLNFCGNPAFCKHANNEGANQPAHPHCWISAFVIRYLESIEVNLVPCTISIF